KTALATSSPQDLLRVILNSAGVDFTKHVDVTVTADDAGASKSAPDVVLVAVDKLGLPPAECAMVGDTPFDAEACVRAHGTGCGGRGRGGAGGGGVVGGGGRGGGGGRPPWGAPGRGCTNLWVGRGRVPRDGEPAAGGAHLPPGHGRGEKGAGPRLPVVPAPAV